MSLADDARAARERGLRFKVARKEARGARWETVEAGLDDLERAVALARTVGAYESGVLVHHPDTSGSIYWTSRYPDLLNTTVITMKVSVHS